MKTIAFALLLLLSVTTVKSQPGNPPDDPITPAEWIENMNFGGWWLFTIPLESDNNIKTDGYSTRILDSIQALGVNGGRLQFDASDDFQDDLTLNDTIIQFFDTIIDDMLDRGMSVCFMVDFYEKDMTPEIIQRAINGWRQFCEAYKDKSYYFIMSPVIEFHGWEDYYLVNGDTIWSSDPTYDKQVRIDSFNWIYDTLTYIYRETNPDRIISYKPYAAARKADFESLAIPFADDPALDSGEPIYYMASMSGSYGLGEWERWSPDMDPQVLDTLKEQTMRAGFAEKDQGLHHAIEYREQTGLEFWIDHWDPAYWKNFKTYDDSKRWTYEQNLAYIKFFMDTLKAIGTAGAGIQTNKFWNDKTNDLIRIGDKFWYGALETDTMSVLLRPLLDSINQSWNIQADKVTPGNPPDDPITPAEWIENMGIGSWWIFTTPNEGDNRITIDNYSHRIVDSLHALGINGGRLHWQAFNDFQDDLTLPDSVIAFFDTIIDDMLDDGMSVCLQVHFTDKDMTSEVYQRTFNGWRQVCEAYKNKSHYLTISPVIEFHGWEDYYLFEGDTVWDDGSKAYRAIIQDSLNWLYDTLTVIYREYNPTRIISYKPWGSSVRAELETLDFPFGNDPALDSGEPIYYMGSFSGSYGMGDWYKWKPDMDASTLQTLKEQAMRAGYATSDFGIHKAINIRDTTGLQFWIDHWDPAYWAKFNKGGDSIHWTIEQNLAYIKFMIDTMKAIGTCGAGIQTNKYWNDKTDEFIEIGDKSWFDTLSTDTMSVRLRHLIDSISQSWNHTDDTTVTIAYTPLSPEQWMAKMHIGSWMKFVLPENKNDDYAIPYKPQIIDTLKSLGIYGGRLDVDMSEWFNNSYMIEDQYLDTLESVVDDFLEKDMVICLTALFTDATSMEDTTKQKYFNGWRQLSERFANKSYNLAMCPVDIFKGWNDYGLSASQEIDSLNWLYDTLTVIYRESNPSRIMVYKPYGIAYRGEVDNLAFPFGNDPGAHSGKPIYYMASVSSGYGDGDWDRWEENMDTDVLDSLKLQALTAGYANPDRGILRAVNFRDTSGIEFWIDHWEPNFWRNYKKTFPDRWTVEQNYQYFKFLTDTLLDLKTCGAGVRLGLLWNEDKLRMVQLGDKNFKGLDEADTLAVKILNRLRLNYDSSMCVWIGAKSTQWDEPDNWLNKRIPDSTSDVRIPDLGVAFAPEIMADTIILNKLEVESNGSLTLDNSVVLRAKDNIIISDNMVLKDSAILYITKNMQVDGSLKCSTIDSRIETVGADTQHIAFDNCYNITFNGSSVVVLESDIIINGIFYLYSTLNPGNHTISVAGNWKNYGVFNYDSSTVIFSGVKTQFVREPSSDSGFGFFNITVSNSSDRNPVIKLQNSARINGNAEFISGIVGVNDGKVLLFSEDATTSGCNSTSYVDGTVGREGVKDFVFPLGKNFYTGMIGISGMDATSTAYFEAYYADSAYSDINNIDNEIDSVCSVDYWDLNRVSGDAEPYITLYWQDSSRNHISDHNTLIVGHYYNGQWNNEGRSSSIINSDSSGYVISENKFTSFSPIALATGNATALPVEVVSFNAFTENTDVILKWSTMSEKNNDYFLIERSSDLSNVNTIGKIEGAGDSYKKIDYTFTDNSPLSGVSYYRLKQVDFNGGYHYSDWISVSVSKNTEVKTSIYPNPGTIDKMFLDIIPGKWQLYKIEIFDSSLKKIAETEIHTNGRYRMKILSIANLDRGYYFIRVSNNEVVTIKGFIVN